VIYIVTAMFPAGPAESFASKAKFVVGMYARKAADRGAVALSVTAYVPVPRKVPWPNHDRARSLGNGLDAICSVLNGDWYSSKHLLIQFVGMDKNKPQDIYTQIINAKVPT
jgi:hypothetical protein